MDGIENSFPDLNRSYLSLTFTMWDGSFPFSKIDTGFDLALDSLVIVDIRSKSTEYGLSNQRKPS